MAFEGDDGGGQVAGVVADEAQGGLGVEGVGGEFEHVVAPVAEAVGGEGCPGEERAGVGFAAGGDVLVADEIAGGYVIGLLEVREQGQQTADLRGVEGFGAVIVELDADGAGVHVGNGAPAAYAGVPGAQVVVQHVVHVAVAADDVVGADLCTYQGEGFEGLRGAVLPGKVDDDVVGLSGI